MDILTNLYLILPLQPSPVRPWTLLRADTTFATTKLSTLFSGPATLFAAAVLTIGAGDVRNASSEEVFDPDRPIRQSWVRTTREPSAQIMEAIREAMVETVGAIEVRFGRLAVKLAIVDGTDVAELDLRLLVIAQCVPRIWTGS
jgi:hypothetical protein